MPTGCTLSWVSAAPAPPVRRFAHAYVYSVHVYVHARVSFIYMYIFMLHVRVHVSNLYISGPGRSRASEKGRAQRAPRNPLPAAVLAAGRRGERADYII